MVHKNVYKIAAKTNFMRSILSIALLLIVTNSFAQPYVDPIHSRYTYGFKNNSGGGTPFSHLYIGPDFPLKLRKNKFFVISPFFEKWNIDSASEKSWLPQVK